jgi:hypothetical protein
MRSVDKAPSTQGSPASRPLSGRHGADSSNAGDALAGTSHSSIRSDQRAQSSLPLNPRSSRETSLGRLPLRPTFTQPIKMIKTGDVIINEAEGHVLIYTRGQVTHAAMGNRVEGVINQETSRFHDHITRLGRSPNELPVYRFTGASTSTRSTAACIASHFASDRTGPGRKEPGEMTPYSSKRLQVAQSDEANIDWTQASAYRAVRAAWRSYQHESFVPLSKTQGTTCASFVVTTLQAAVITDAVVNGVLPTDAQAAFDSMDKNDGFLTGEAKRKERDGQPKETRYEAISVKASNQIKELMPKALQVNAKTMTQVRLDTEFMQPGSGFELVGYARVNEDSIEVLPEDHPDVNR